MLRAIADIGSEWGWLRNGLLAVLAKTKDRWLPEDVYAAIKAGVAFAFALEWKGDDIGFVILRQDADTDGRVLFVWVLWCEPNSLGHIGDDVMAAIDAKAHAIGAKRIRMHSPRKGWQALGHFEAVTTIFEREV